MAEIHTKKYETQSQKAAKYDLICGLYSMILPRRAEDMSLLILGDDLKTNCIILEPAAPSIIFRIYKTSSIRGDVVIKIPSELVNLINVYIREFNIKMFDRLFLMPAKAFSKLVSTAFKKKYNINITINTIRHYRATEIGANNYNIYERTQLARAMGHSFLMNIQYSRVPRPRQSLHMVGSLPLPQGEA